MALFLTEIEKEQVHEQRMAAPMAQFIWALQNRCMRRTKSPGLITPDTTVEWWHCYSEYVTDAAMLYALKPNKELSRWLNSVVMDAVRQPEAEWMGPLFRGRWEPATGHLETAHLSWATSVAIDLAPTVFSDEELQEIKTILRDRAIPMCRRWMDSSRHLANWRCILLGGIAVPAAILGDEASIGYASEQYKLCVEAFQADGSYSESLQYSSYAMYGLMMTYEALVRYRPELADELPVERYARSMRWHASSLLYMKPLAGWGAHPKPRAANFNDSAGMFVTNPDVLLHIASRCREELPTEAGLAKWIQETYAPALPDDGPYDRQSFGFRNTFGFLTLPLLTQAATAITPQEAGLGDVEEFSNGDVLVRDSWEGKTILATHGGGDPLNGPGHLHADLNSFILAHNEERLLVDPGHSCYRSLIHSAEVTTATHNTLTFQVEGGGILQQHTSTGRRDIVGATDLGPSVDRGASRLIAASKDDVRVVGSQVTRAYGKPIRFFNRFWIMCGTHAIFIVDHVEADEPVRVTWNWLLNNRDGILELKTVPPDRMVVRRGATGMKLFHCGDGDYAGATNSWVHDCYHPLPNQKGEGANGTGVITRWLDNGFYTNRQAVTAIAVDDYGVVAGWHLFRQNGAPMLESPDKSEQWVLEVSPRTMTLTERASGRAYVVGVGKTGDCWELS